MRRAQPLVTGQSLIGGVALHRETISLPPPVVLALLSSRAARLIARVATALANTMAASSAYPRRLSASTSATSNRIPASPRGNNTCRYDASPGCATVKCQN